MQVHKINIGNGREKFNAQLAILKKQLENTQNKKQVISEAVQCGLLFEFSKKLTRVQVHRLCEARECLNSQLISLWKVGIALQEAELPANQFFTGLNIAYAYVGALDELLNNSYNRKLAEFNEQREKAVHHGKK